MDSLWVDCMKEEYGREVYMTAAGFVSYKIYEAECLIYDLFVEKSLRGCSEGQRLTNKLFEIAKEAECKFVTCLVDVNGDKATKGTMLCSTYMRYGFKIVGCDNDRIVMKRDI